MRHSGVSSEGQMTSKQNLSFSAVTLCQDAKRLSFFHTESFVRSSGSKLATVPTSFATLPGVFDSNSAGLCAFIMPCRVIYINLYDMNQLVLIQRLHLS